MPKGACMFKKKIKATIVDAEIDNEITYPHELNEDYMNNCLNDSGISAFFDDGSIDLQIQYTRLVIKYYINGKEHTEKISNCYIDRAVRKGATISVVYNPVDRTVSLPFYCD